MLITEPGPSTSARLLSQAVRTTVRTTLRASPWALPFPWPFGIVEKVAGLIPKPPGTRVSTVQLPQATAQLVRAPGDLDPTRVILYCHGGGFIACGPNTHAGLISRLSQYSNAPVLAVDYRMVPAHSVADSVNDCLDAYLWLRRHYDPGQIVIAGDSAGGYLALMVALTARAWGEMSAGLALLSPLLQLDPGPKKAHPNMKCDAMFGAEAFDALSALVRKANGGGLHEPLDWLLPGLPPTMIQVSGQEVLLHDARLAYHRLSDLGVPVEMHVWPGQVHVFQFAAALVPEANRSLKQVGAFIVARTVNSAVCNDFDLTMRTTTVG